MVISPFGSIGTFMKKLMLGTMSRLPMPCFVTSSTKLSRQACRYLVSWPKRTVLLSQEQAPAEVSCRPQLSAIIVSMTLPSFDMILVPSADIGGALRAHGVLGGVALGRSHRRGRTAYRRLLALAVDDADGLALADDAGPRRFGRDEMILDSIFRLRDAEV